LDDEQSWADLQPIAVRVLSVETH